MPVHGPSAAHGPDWDTLGYGALGGHSGSSHSQVPTHLGTHSVLWTHYLSNLQFPPAPSHACRMAPLPLLRSPRWWALRPHSGPPRGSNNKESRISAGAKGPSHGMCRATSGHPCPHVDIKMHLAEQGTHWAWSHGLGKRQLKCPWGGLL